MIIGVPKEIKNNENRVGMTPAGVAICTRKNISWLGVSGRPEFH